MIQANDQNMNLWLGKQIFPQATKQRKLEYKNPYPAELSERKKINGVAKQPYHV